MHLLITRPEADAGAMAARLEGMGHRVSQAPLLSVGSIAAATDVAHVQALLVTSRNALREIARWETLSSLCELPLVAVGEATGALARQLGFRDVTAGRGGARELLPIIEQRFVPGGGGLLYLTGEEVAVDLTEPLTARGYRVERRRVYTIEDARLLPAAVLHDLKTQGFDGVVLMSPRTARVFTDLCQQNGIVELVRPVTFFCLSPAVADGLKLLAPEHCLIANKPSSEEVLALVSEMASNRRI